MTTLQRVPRFREYPTVANADARRLLNTRDMKSRIAGLGATPIGNTPEQFRAQIRDDLARRARMIKLSGATPE